MLAGRIIDIDGAGWIIIMIDQGQFMSTRVLEIEDEITALLLSVVCDSVSLTRTCESILDTDDVYWQDLLDPNTSSISNIVALTYFNMSSVPLFPSPNGNTERLRFRGRRTRINKESPEAMHRLSQAVTLVNLNLSTPEALPSSNISVVNILVVREMLRGNRESAEIHLMGLRKMIALRGGLKRLEGEDRTFNSVHCAMNLMLGIRWK